MIKTLYNTVSGKKIALLGWAFKKDTNDSRESSAISIADYLLNEEALIAVYDPKAPITKVYSDLNYLDTRSPMLNSKLVTGFSDLYQACAGAHAIAIMTEWDEFKGYDWNIIYDKISKPALVFDGRGLLDGVKLKSIGFEYYSIGQ
jgi:UDPglucose 6-dehydrogenase